MGRYALVWDCDFDWSLCADVEVHAFFSELVSVFA